MEDIGLSYLVTQRGEEKATVAKDQIQHSLKDENCVFFAL